MAQPHKNSDKPQWPPEQQGKFYGFISGITNLTCEAKAEPAAEFTWMNKYNEVVKEGTVVNEARKSVLMVSRVKASSMILLQPFCPQCHP